jgi:hypothetical protein
LRHKPLTGVGIGPYIRISTQTLAVVPIELNPVWVAAAHSDINALYATERAQINWDRQLGSCRSWFVLRTVLSCPFYGVPPDLDAAAFELR